MKSRLSATINSVDSSFQIDSEPDSSHSEHTVILGTRVNEDEETVRNSYYQEDDAVGNQSVVIEMDEIDTT